MNNNHFKLMFLFVFIFSLIFFTGLLSADVSAIYGSFNNNIVNGYQKVSYTNSKTTYNVYIYKSNSKQDIAPAIRTTGDKDYLSELNPTDINTVQAKVNGSTMESFNNIGTSFYGLYYYKGILYKDGSTVKQGFLSPTLWDPKSGIRATYFPSFCIYKNGTVTIKWPTKQSDFIDMNKNCSIVIGCQHPMVYNGKTIYEHKRTLRTTDDNTLVWSHFHQNNGFPDKKVERTLIGHTSNGSYYLVCAYNMTLKTAGQLMKDLNCDYAVNMDGGPGTQMRLTRVGRITPDPADKNYYGTAITIYNK